MATCCPSFIGGRVDLIIRNSGASGSRYWKFSTEDAVTLKPRNFTHEDRQNLGHVREPNNSYIEATVPLKRGIFSNDPSVGGSSIDFDDDVDDISDIFEMCNAEINIVAECGDTYTMRSAVYTGDGTFDIKGGTATLRFSSIYDIIDTNSIDAGFQINI